MAVQQLSDGAPDGWTAGRNSADVGAFFGATAATRPSGAGQAAVTATPGTTSGSALVASLQSVGVANTTLINQLRSDLVALGLIAGA